MDRRSYQEIRGRDGTQVIVRCRDFLLHMGWQGIGGLASSDRETSCADFEFRACIQPLFRRLHFFFLSTLSNQKSNETVHVEVLAQRDLVQVV